MESGLRILSKDKTLKTGCFSPSRVSTGSHSQLSDLPKHKTHHVSPLIKILTGVSTEFHQVQVLQRGWKALHNQIPVNLHSKPQTSPSPPLKHAQTPRLGLMRSLPTIIHSLPHTFLELHTCLLMSLPCTLASFSSQSFCYHSSGETSWPSALFLLRLIQVKHCCSHLFALPSEAGAGTTDTS